MNAQLLRVSEVAERLGQREETIRRKLVDGTIPGGVRIASGPRAPFRVRADELEAWLRGEDEDER